MMGLQSLTNFIQALAYFPVSLYMTVYTTSLGLSSLNGALVLSVFNFSSIIGGSLSSLKLVLYHLPKKLGQIIFGHACDIAPYQYVIIFSGAGAALSAYLLWGFAHSLSLIFAFAIIFGSLVCSSLDHSLLLLIYSLHREVDLRPSGQPRP